MSVETLKAAQKYLRMGISVIPMNPLGHEKEKAPAVKSWTQYQISYAEEGAVKRWWGNGSNNRLAIVTGPISQKIAVLDVDNLELAKRIKADGEWRAGKTIVETPSGGLHIYYREKVASRNTNGLVGIGDTRAEGGYVGAPPSEGYKWIQKDQVPWVQNLDEYVKDEFCPYFGVAYIRGKGKGKKLPDKIEEGTRNDTLFRLASFLRGKGLSQEAILAALQVENRDRTSPGPISEKELETIVASGSKYDPDVEREALSDLGNARRFLGRHGKDVKYVEGRGWLVWDGTKWARDSLRMAQKLAQETVLAIKDEVSDGDDEATRTSVLKWASGSQSEVRLRSMLNIARDEAAVRDSDFDTDRYLLNCQNGTINLKTGKLHAHRRGDLITKVTSVEYDDGARAPKFQKFLRRIIPDKDEREFLKRALGYSLTGDVSEQVVFILWGGGQNGKSTLVNTVRRLMGNYAESAPVGFMMEKRGESHPTELADLESTRLFVASEPKSGGRLDEAFVKQSTGGESIKARRMRQDFYEFEPTHKLFLLTNYKPIIQGTDTAIWRRIHLVPFTVEIPTEERVLNFEDKLIDEWPGILSWLVEGALEWREKGLLRPRIVVDATKEYRDDMDQLGVFLEDRCQIKRGLTCTAQALYRAYVNWASNRGEKPLSQTWLGRRLKDRGFEQIRDVKGSRAWNGVIIDAKRVKI